VGQSKESDREEEGGRRKRTCGDLITGHTSAGDVEAGKITEENRKGNGSVDVIAKEGARMQACPRNLVDSAKRRTKVGKVLQEGFANILMRRL
jgi:hypothetical protein